MCFFFVPTGFKESLHFIHIREERLVLLIQSLIRGPRGRVKFYVLCCHSPPLSAPSYQARGPFRVLAHGSRKEGLREFVNRHHLILLGTIRRGVMPDHHFNFVLFQPLQRG